MDAINVILTILMVISSLALIASVLMQSSDDNGMNALSGATGESFFSKNKMSTLEGKLAMVTKISAIAFVVLALLMLIIPD